MSTPRETGTAAEILLIVHESNCSGETSGWNWTPHARVPKRIA